MDIIDFFIGLTLVNALPHFVLGVWKGRMLSLFGFGDIQNILYGLLNIFVSLILFYYKYGFSQFIEHGIFFGGLFVVLMYLVLGNYLFRKFNREARVDQKA